MSVDLDKLKSELDHTDEARRWPRVGDVWEKTKLRTGTHLQRRVIQFDGSPVPGHDSAQGDVVYRNEKGLVKKCWTSTWHEWTRAATLVTRGPDPDAPREDPHEGPKDSFIQVRIPRKLRERISRYRERCGGKGVVPVNFSYACRAAIEAVLGGKTSDDPSTWGSCPFCKGPREPRCRVGCEDEEEL